VGRWAAAGSCHRAARARRACAPGEIRAWAGQQGIAVSGHGRIPAGVVAQYHAAANGR
jgi:hypothetical protein